MSQSVITIFEDRTKKVNLTDEQADDILSFKNVIGSNRLSLSRDGFLTVNHYVGFISKGTTRLQILPKVYEDADLYEESEQKDSIKTIMNLLRYSDFNKVLELPDQSSFADNDDLLELFISIFANKVFQTYSRQMNREYIEITENSPFIKGRILFADNLKTNPVRKDLHIVNYESYEEDNLLNNIIKTTCLLLIKSTKNDINKKLLNKALILLDDAKRVNLTNSLFGSIRFNQLNMPFKPVFDIAKMFFYNISPQSYVGDDSVFSFLVPLNELFEQYVFKLFELSYPSCIVRYQDQRKFIFGDAIKSSKTIRPDIVIYKDNYPIFIVDAKYKNPQFENDYFTNISQSDIYQLFAYSKAYGANKVAIVYPVFNENVKRKSLLLKDNNSEITIDILSINIKNEKYNLSHFDSLFKIDIAVT